MEHVIPTARSTSMRPGPMAMPSPIWMRGRARMAPGLFEDGLIHTGYRKQPVSGRLRNDILRRAKITAIERGSSLRQLVVDALKHEMEPASRSSRRRLTSPPVKLAADSPLRTLTPDEVKRLDTEAEIDAEVTRANALDR